MGIQQKLKINSNSVKINRKKELFYNETDKKFFVLLKLNTNLAFIIYLNQVYVRESTARTSFTSIRS